MDRNDEIRIAATLCRQVEAFVILAASTAAGISATKDMFLALCERCWDDVHTAIEEQVAEHGTKEPTP